MLERVYRFPVPGLDAALTFAISGHSWTMPVARCSPRCTSVLGLAGAEHTLRLGRLVAWQGARVELDPSPHVGLRAAALDGAPAAVQYVIHPGGARASRNALALGLTISLSH